MAKSFLKTASAWQKQAWRRKKGMPVKLCAGPFVALVLIFWTASILRWSSTASSSTHDFSATVDHRPSRKTRAPGNTKKMKINDNDPIFQNKDHGAIRKDNDYKALKSDTGAKEDPQLVLKNDREITTKNQGDRVVKPNQKGKHKLRFDWTNLPVQSPLAKEMLAHQTNCSLPLGNFKYRNRFGLGSDLHVWGQGLCNAYEGGVRLRTQLPWIFWDEEACEEYADKKSAMLCYFPSSELNCPGDVEASVKNAVETPISPSNSGGCKGILGKYGDEVGIQEVRAAGIELLFREISPVLLNEAERQISLVFPDGIPEGLITVHIRWGDKKREMKLRKVGEYINAVKKILRKRKSPEDSAHIFLATEDPEALQQFTGAMPKGWKLYVDQFYHEMLPYRIDEYNGNPKMSRKLKGKTGLIALGSLLVAAESDYYVLTTASNWSRLMNELRKNVIDPRCNNCSIMIDLKAGEW